MARICPDCSTQLVDEVVDGVTVNGCPQCAGVWVHPEALTEILARDPAGLLELEAKNVPKSEQKFIGKSIRNCPEDGMTLNDYHYCYDSPVILQVCTDCGGFWIMDGQLKKMQDYLNEANQPTTKLERDQIAMANDIADHETFMYRQQNLTRVFNNLRRFSPGWYI